MGGRQHRPGAPHRGHGLLPSGLLAGEMLRVNPKRYAAAVSFSGFLAHGELPGDDELARLKPPMFYGHGSADDIFPKSELDAMNAFYASHTTLTEKSTPHDAQHQHAGAA